MAQGTDSNAPGYDPQLDPNISATTKLYMRRKAGEQAFPLSPAGFGQSAQAAAQDLGQIFSSFLGGKRTGYAPGTPTEDTATAAAAGTPTTVDLAALNKSTTGGYSAGSANAALDAAAKKYWANVNQYGQQRTNAMRDFYSGLSGATARTGADIARGGQGLAADIEALYERLGQQSQIQPGAAGTVTPQTAYGALTPISGAQATAAQQIPAAGASLADYLGSQQNAAAATFLGTSAAQAAQGQGAISDLVMNIQAARAQEEYNRAQQKIANNQRASALSQTANTDAQMAQFLAMQYDAMKSGNVSTDKKLNESAKKQAELLDKFAANQGTTVAGLLATAPGRTLVQQYTSGYTAG
jgi:hypothetical protein